MNIHFKGKVALVTGAGKGIGRETCIRLSECGAQVVAISRTQSDLDSLSADHPEIRTLCLDLTETALIKSELPKLGPIDLLVNNAAVGILEEFLTISEEAFDKQFNVNVKACIFVAQMVARGMVERGNGGAIVNVSSQASQAAIKSHTVYAATKAALDQITRVMALELGEHQIRTNSINPTVVLTDMGKIGWSDPVKANQMKVKIPLGKFAEVSDVVDAIIYLLSDKASMINGVTLPIDGGFLAC